MDIPPQCPPDFTLFDVFRIQVEQYTKTHVNQGYPCFIQTPDNLKGKDPEGYPYFDFEAAGVAKHSQVVINDASFYTLILYGVVPLMLFAVGLIIGLLM